MTKIQSWMVCIECHAPATQFFDGNQNYPMCGQRICDEQLVEEINNELKDAAEASKEQ